MSRVLCNVCKGEYDDVLPDGSRYFHQCPPLGIAELKDAIDRGAVSLSASQQKRVDQARQLDVEKPAYVSAAEQQQIDDAAAANGLPKPERAKISRVDAALAEFAIARPGARNENVIGIAGGRNAHDPIAPGAGVTSIADVDAPAPMR